MLFISSGQVFVFNIGGNKYRLIASAHFNRGKLEVLAYLIEEHTLPLSELPKLSSQENVKAILQGKQKLTAPQIKALASRFDVAPETFL